MKRTIDLGKVDYNQSGRKINKCTLDVEITKAFVFKASGGIWNSKGTDFISAGQNVDEIAELFPNNEMVQRIHKLWKEYHLNDMNAGTIEQDQVLREYELKKWDTDFDLKYKQMKSEGNIREVCDKAANEYAMDKRRGYREFQNSKDVLNDNGKLESIGADGEMHSYGSIWHKHELPVEIIMEMQDLIEPQYEILVNEVKNSWVGSDEELLDELVEFSASSNRDEMMKKLVEWKKLKTPNKSELTAISSEADNGSYSDTSGVYSTGECLDAILDHIITDYSGIDVALDQLEKLRSDFRKYQINAEVINQRQTPKQKNESVPDHNQ